MQSVSPYSPGETRQQHFLLPVQSLLDKDETKTRDREGNLGRLLRGTCQARIQIADVSCKFGTQIGFRLPTMLLRDMG